MPIMEVRQTKDCRFRKNRTRSSRRKKVTANNPISCGGSADVIHSRVEGTTGPVHSPTVTVGPVHAPTAKSQSCTIVPVARPSLLSVTDPIQTRLGGDLGPTG